MQLVDVYSNRIYYALYSDGTATPAKIYVYNPDTATNILIHSASSNRFCALKVMAGLLWISHSNGSLWSFNGASVFLRLSTPFASTNYVTAMAEYAGQMYFGTSRGDIYRSSDGTSYNYVATPGTAGKQITDFASWKGHLYCANYEDYSYSSKVFRSADGATWATVTNVSVYNFQAFVPTTNYLYLSSTDNAGYLSFAIRGTTNGTAWSQVWYTTTEGKAAVGRPVWFSQTGRAYFITSSAGRTRLVPLLNGTVETRFDLAHGFNSLVEMEGRLFALGSSNAANWASSPYVVSLLGYYQPGFHLLSGSLSYSGVQTGTIVVLASSGGTNYSTALYSPGAYAFTNLIADSNYWITAFRDTNGNGSNDFWEPQGSYPGNPIFLTNDVTGVNITLTDSDSDLDGMPDWWEIQYGLNPNSGIFGDGSDGSLTVNAGQTNFTDSVRADVVGTNAAGAATLSVSTTNGFATNDLVLIIAMQDPNTNLAQNIAGTHEFGRIVSISSNFFTLSQPRSNAYTVASTQRVQVLKVPEYTDVTVNGTVACQPWNGTNGGVLVFLTRGLMIGANGSVSVNGCGFRGGINYAAASVNGYQGESYSGAWPQRSVANNFGGGGGGGWDNAYAGNGGGGGGYGATGSTGLVPSGQSGGNSTSFLGGSGGSTYGTTNLVRMFLGSGGGSGGQDGNDSGDGNLNGGAGGNGGGIIFLIAGTVTNNGEIVGSGQVGFNGTAGERGGGGGGAGGTLWLTIGAYVGTGGVAAVGSLGGLGNTGAPRGDGGTGGVGRVRFNLPQTLTVPSSQPPATIASLRELPTGLHTISDTDADGLTDLQEYQLGTNPIKTDTDGDGMPDGWEVENGLNPLVNDADGDFDSDGLTNLLEYQLGTKANQADSDGDGLSDSIEYYTHRSDPTNTDTDGDGMPDGWEVTRGLNPLVNDANDDRDLDGLTNLQEYQNGLNPRNVLSSAGGVFGKTDYEWLFGKTPNKFYYDKLDRLIGAEYNRGSNGLSIAYVYDGNGNILRQVYLQRNRSGDGVPDLWKFLHGLSYTNANAYEDSDGDGWTNYQEWKAGSDPLDPASVPNLLGTTGTSIVNFSPGFTPSNFVMAAGQLDGIGAEEIVIGADGNPGGVTNSLLILTQSTPASWSTQTVAVGTVGVTSIAIGQVNNSPSPAIYIGTRSPNGTGTVMEVKNVGGVWQANSLSLGNTSQVAYVLGVRSDNDILAHLSPTNAPNQSLFSLVLSDVAWNARSVDTNASHRGLGSFALRTSNDPSGTSLRLIDNGKLQFGPSALILPTDAVFRSDYGAWYWLTDTATTWSNAELRAQQYGGHLVSISDSSKNSWLRSQFVGSFWLGLVRDCCSCGWRWVNGTPFSYTRWASGEPNCSGGNEFYGQMRDDDYWNDLPNAGPLKGVAELPAVALTNSVAMNEPPATSPLLWRGYSLASGFTRQTIGVSIFYTFVDDKNTNTVVDTGDDFVVTEYLLSGTNYTTVTSNRLSVVSSPASPSYGLTCANILDSSNDVFFTAEPGGNVYSWALPAVSNQLSALGRNLFDGHYAGKAWHQLSRHRGLETGDSLVGLLVDPASPNQVSLIRWEPRAELPVRPDIRQTAPRTQILPTPNSGGALSTVNIRIWDAEGNASVPSLQYSITSNVWVNATVSAVDGGSYNVAVTAMPTGTTHALSWDALADLGAGYSNTVLLQARSHDFIETGDWSPATTYTVVISTNSVGDGIPYWWRQQYFGDGASTNSVSCAACDPDGDGMNNMQEYLTGTVPTNSASAFRIISISIHGTNTVITWRTAGGKTNVVQGGAGDLDNNSTSYSNLFYDMSDPIVILGSGDVVTNFLDDGSWWGEYSNGPVHYYRIRLGP